MLNLGRGTKERMTKAGREDVMEREATVYDVVWETLLEVLVEVQDRDESVAALKMVWDALGEKIESGPDDRTANEFHRLADGP